MPHRWTYSEWKAWREWKAWKAWNARWDEPTTPATQTIHENTELSDGEESNGSQPTESYHFKAHSKKDGYDWMLPRRKWYTVIEDKGKQGRPPRTGMVTCQDGDLLCVHWDDDWVERREMSSVVRSDAPLQPPQYQ